MKSKTPDDAVLRLIASDMYHIDGALWWRERKGYNRRNTKKPVGYLNSGYLCVQVGKKSYKAHRVVWFLTHGAWPTLDIDHIDGNKINNNPDNLRLCTPTANMQNCSKVNSSSGYRGVSWNKKSSKWLVRITDNSRRICLGYFEDPELAGLVYETAHAKLFPDTSPYKQRI